MSQFPTYQPIDENGWTAFVFPEKNYWMECCDCGLVHEFEFSAISTEPADGGFHSNELPWPENRVRFRVRRSQQTPVKNNDGYAVARELWKAANAVGFGEFQCVVERLIAPLTKQRIAEIAIDFYDAGDGDTEHGHLDIDGFAEALCRAQSTNGG